MRRSHLAILLAAGSLTLGLAALAPERAEAAPINAAEKIVCQAGQWFWSDTLGCANKLCVFNGEVYEGGESVVVGNKAYYCDGWTGKMVELIRRPPTSSLLKLTYY
jgi:hypothetical protein